jgi:hypothetical protein
MRPSPPKSTIEDLARPVLPEPNERKSPAPAVVVQCWCGMVQRMDPRAPSDAGVPDSTVTHQSGGSSARAVAGAPGASRLAIGERAAQAGARTQKVRPGGHMSRLAARKRVIKIGRRRAPAGSAREPLGRTPSSSGQVAHAQQLAPHSPANAGVSGRAACATLVEARTESAFRAGGPLA